MLAALREPSVTPDSVDVTKSISGGEDVLWLRGITFEGHWVHGVWETDLDDMDSGMIGLAEKWQARCGLKISYITE
jgi:hypothetical protein